MHTPDWDRIHEIYDEARKLPRAEPPLTSKKPLPVMRLLHATSWIFLPWMMSLLWNLP